MQRIRVPQGSKLSVTLFAVKINSLATVIPREVFSLLFVDDLLIAYSDDTVKGMEMKLQSTINRITVWANSNGFKFSITKTNMMHFYKNVTLVISPTLKVAGAEISKSDCARFLGMYWDPKLSWTNHIAKLKVKCMADLNLLRSVSTEEWGADMEVLMRLYKAIIRSKIDYGSIVYGAASEAVIKQLNVVLNEARRSSTGAFKSTPVKSLNILTNEIELCRRREEQMLRYYCKMKCYFQNPAYSSVADQNLLLYFRSRAYTDSPLVCRTKDIMGKYEMHIQPILPYITPKRCSWKLRTPEVCGDLTEMNKIIMSDSSMRQLHQVNIKAYKDHRIIYTDVSKQECGVGASAVMDTTIRRASLPSAAGILTAELTAIGMALDIIENTPHRLYIIATVSLSSIRCIENHTVTNHLVQKLTQEFHQNITAGKEIVPMWVPSHVGI